MISEFVASLFAMFVVDPVIGEIRTQLDRAGASTEVIAEAGDCLASTGPILLRRAGDDLWWAASTAISVSAGWQGPAELLDAGNPACGPLATFLTTSDLITSGATS